MIKNIFKPFLVLLVLLAFNNFAKGATKIWLGGTAGADNWNIASNWSSTGVPTSTDDVQIGIATFTNQPTISTGTPSCLSITFGVKQSITLTINGVTLTIGAGGFLQNHNSVTGLSNISNNIQGTGTLTCTGFTVGDNITPPTPASGSTYTTTINCSINILNVNGTLNLNSTQTPKNGVKFIFNNPVFNLKGGTLNVTNITISASNFLTGNAETFNMGTSTTANTLNISGSITVPANIGGTVSFLSAVGNTSASTVNYTGSGQTVYTTADAAFLKSTPTNYGNLSFSNSGTKTPDAGTLTVGGTMVNNTGSTFSGNSTAETATITGAFTNNGTINVNNEAFTFNSTASNTGTYAPGTGSGTSTFSNGLTNSGTFTGGAGAIGVTGTLTNTGGTITGGTGTITIATLTNTSGNINGSSTTGTITVSGTSGNSGTITVNNGTMHFAGLFTNNSTGIYTGGTGSGISTFSNGVTNSGSFTGGAGAINITAGTGTLTNNSGGTVTGGAGTITIATLTNNSGGNVNGNATAGAITVSGILTNAGTIAVNSGTMTFTGAASNSGTYTGGAGTSTFTTGLTNTGSVTESTGLFTIGNLVNTSPGTFTGNSATATTSITGTLNNSGTITVNAENMTFTGAATNSGTYTGGAGISTFNGAFTNSGGTFATGTGNVDFNNSYTNSGTFTANTTGNVIFGLAGAQTLTDNSTAGTTFYNVQIQGSGTKTMGGSKGFYVASTGILTMGGTATLAGGGVLTLNSDANSTATVAAIPLGCSITGIVNVQRFIKGSSTDLTKRGYRLLTSTVYTGIDASSGSNVNVFDFNYLVNSVLLSGAGYAANGFTVTSNENPSLYLFREDDTPPANNSIVFTTGYNWKGVAKINNSPVYNIGTQKSKTGYNVADTTTTIPVGNGFLLYFRGNTTLNNGTNGGTGSKTTAPFNFPEDVTLTETGNLNTGTINVRLWFANAANGLGNNLSYTSANTSGSTSSLTGGYTLVGNPYPATINWEKYNMNGTNSSIYGGGGLVSKIYVFDEYNKQYEAYLPASTGDTTSVNPGTASGPAASNMIASGQGFFVKATATGQTLSFRETAKTSTQPVASSLNKLMGKPKAFAAVPQPLLRLKFSIDSINTDEIVIRLNNNASTKFVDNEDAEDLGGSGNLLGLSAFSSDSIKLAISSQPFPGQQQQVTRLFTGAVASGLYRLSRTQLDNLPALYDVWLKDAFMKDSLDLKANTTYQFNIDKSNPATFGSDRFTLVIRQNPAYAYRLLDFTAARVGNSSHVEVDWKVENEQNYTNFTVERSIDGGKTFDVVGGLQGSGAGTYSLLDKNPNNGQNLYRLKQEDINNTITYSKVVQVQYSDLSNNLTKNYVNVYPNPVISTINVAVASDAGSNPPYTIQISNSSGLLIKKVTSAQPNWQGNVSDLMSGTYLIKVKNSRDNTIVGDTKFVKL